jgi:2-polyprenyl-3-methyl-5-hydroxy-6-metoxy-1,4-benzoquinol methylase
MKSPLSSGPAACIRSLPASNLVEGYKNQYGIDVSHYFSACPEVFVYECRETGYRFYYPLELEGKADLYEHLGKFSWDYKENKWEFDQVLRLVKPGDAVLDIGCGEGSFLSGCSLHGANPVGIELNRAAAAAGVSRGRNIRVESLQRHAEIYAGHYDFVCLFQVLEHVASPREFLVDAVRLLKDGGRLAIGVPNNRSFMRHDPCAVLNAPPHHMGLWDARSLRSLARLFPLVLEQLTKEPLQEVDWYLTVQIRRLFDHSLLERAIYKLHLDAGMRAVIRALSFSISGHTILAIFRKSTSGGQADAASRAF